MVKPLLIVSAAALFGLTPMPSLLRVFQEPAPAPATAALPQSVPGPTAIPGAGNPVKPTADSQARAKKLYGYDCSMCHNANGDGKTDLAKDMGLTMTDLTTPATLATMTDQQIFELIKDGKGKMPGETGRAKTDELWNLVIYVRSLSKAQTASAEKPAE